MIAAKHEQFSLYFDAAPSEVLERIRLRTGKDDLLPFKFVDLRRKEDVLAQVKGSQIRLRMRQTRPGGRRWLGMPVSRNSWAPAFFGRIGPSNGGSVVTGRFDLHPFVRWFERLWAGAALLAWLFGGIIPLALGRTSANHIAGAIMPLFMLLGLAVGRTFSIALGKKDEQDLRRFFESLAEPK